MNRVPDTGTNSLFSGLRGDPSKALRCGARTRRGTPCKRPAERNPQTGKRTRCRLHGAYCTGPRSQEGKARVAAAQLKHGRYTKVAKEARRLIRIKLAKLRQKTKGKK
jgi:hypothetical protein